MMVFFGTGLLSVVVLACAIWVIYDVLANKKKMSGPVKILWIVGALIFSIITAIVYYFVEKR